MEEIPGAFKIIGGGHEFFAAGEVDDMEEEGGAGFAKDSGVGGSGDDGDAVATCGELCGYVAERDEMAGCQERNEVKVEWWVLIFHYCSVKLHTRCFHPFLLTVLLI